MNIFGRYGGLTLIRQAGETIVMCWDGGKQVILNTTDVTDKSATITIRPDVFPLAIGESIEVPGPNDDRPANCIITLDDIGGERAALRIVAPRRVRIVRGERFSSN